MSMKILLCSESYPPVTSGVSVSVYRLALGMQARGHEVQVLTPHQPHDQEADQTSLLPIHRLPSQPNPFRKGYRFSAPAVRRITSIIASFQPDIIHVHDIGLTCRIAVSVGRRRDIPVVATHHFIAEGLMEYYFPMSGVVSGAVLPVITGSVTRLYNRCQRVAVPTEFMHRYLKTWPSLRTPVQVISNGVDTARFKPDLDEYQRTAVKLRYGIPLQAPLLGYVGRIDPEKNLEIVLRALATLGQDTTLHLVMAGRGNLVEQYKALAHDLGIAERVTWLPPLAYDDPEFPAFFGILDVFCIPSPNETESMVTLEAMACGLPIIAADKGPLLELVDDQNGAALDPRNIALWADTLTLILTLPATERRRLGAVSRTRAEERGLTASLDLWEQVYTEEIASANL